MLGEKDMQELVDQFAAGTANLRESFAHHLNAARQCHHLSTSILPIDTVPHASQTGNPFSRATEVRFSA